MINMEEVKYDVYGRETVIPDYITKINDEEWNKLLKSVEEKQQEQEENNSEWNKLLMRLLREAAEQLRKEYITSKDAKDTFQVTPIDTSVSGNFRSRMFTEYSELQRKINKLKELILSDTYGFLPEVEKVDLREQLKFMNGYCEVLGQRVSRQCNSA